MQTRTEHIGIVETVYALVSRKVLHVAQALKDPDSRTLCRPRVAHIVGGTPTYAACFGTPFPGFAGAPFADIQPDVASGVLQGFGHGMVTFLGTFHIGRSKAIVVFQDVDSPLGIMCGIDRLHTIRPEGTGTGFLGSIGIDAEAHAMVMDILCGSLDATGETGGIGARRTVVAPRTGMPPVVEHHSVPAAILQTLVLKKADNTFNDILRNFALYGIPRYPSHERDWQWQIVGDMERDVLLTGFVGGGDIDAIGIGALGLHNALHQLARSVPGESCGELLHSNRGIGVGGTDFLHETHTGLREDGSGTGKTGGNLLLRHHNGA